MRTEFGEQAFGVLAKIDVAATLAATLGIERPPLKIPCACKSPLARRAALELDPSVRLLSPCKVVLEPAPGGPELWPSTRHELMDGPSFAALVDQAADRLRGALDAAADRN